MVVADKRQTRRAGSEYAQDYHGAQHGNSGIVIDDGVAAAGMKSHALWPTGVVALNPGYEPASFPYHPGGGSVATEVSDEIYDDVRFRPRSSTTVSPAAAEVKLVLHVSKFALQPRIVTLFPSTQFHLDLTTSFTQSPHANTFLPQALPLLPVVHACTTCILRSAWL